MRPQTGQIFRSSQQRRTYIQRLRRLILASEIRSRRWRLAHARIRDYPLYFSKVALFHFEYCKQSDCDLLTSQVKRILQRALIPVLIPMPSEERWLCSNCPYHRYRVLRSAPIRLRTRLGLLLVRIADALFVR